MDGGWLARLRQWGRFNQWEAESLGREPSDYSAALRWMTEAWDLARRLDPGWDDRASVEEHWRHLVRVREGLSRMRPGA